MIATGLLWDLDNVTTGVVHDSELADEIVALCHPSRLLFAAGHAGTYESHRRMLTAKGLKVFSGGWGRDGADRLLLRHGNTMASRGVTTLFVASNDGVFARLPTTCHIRVLTLTPNLVSQRLRDRAVDVVTLPDPRGASYSN